MFLKLMGIFSPTTHKAMAGQGYLALGRAGSGKKQRCCCLWRRGSTLLCSVCCQDVLSGHTNA